MRLPLFVAMLRFRVHLCVDCKRVLLSCVWFVCLCLYVAFCACSCIRLPYFVAVLRFGVHLCVDCTCVLLSCVSLVCLRVYGCYV